VALNANDEIFVGGYSDSGLGTDFVIIKLTNTGVLDTTFNEMSLTPGIVIEDFRETDDQAFAIALDNDDRIVIGGFSSDGVRSDFALARFNPDGSLDTTFNDAGIQLGRPGTVITPLSTGTDEIHGLALDSNNNIVVTGFSDNGVNRTFATVRYTPNGLLDATFNPSGIIPGVVITNIVPVLLGPLTGLSTTNDNQASAVVIQEDNSILITGFSNDGNQRNFTTINYLQNGDLNTNFNAFGDLSLIPGVVFTRFGISTFIDAHGVPLNVYTDVSQVEPELIEGLRAFPEPTIPTIVNTGPIITNQLQPTLSGFAAPNSLVTIYINDVELTSTVADYKGAWTATLPPLFDGSYTTAVLSTDAFSGVSLASLPVSLTVDTHIPEPPLITFPKMNDQVRIEPLLIQGRAEPDSLVSLFLQDTEVARVFASAQGEWSYQTEPLQDGTYSLTTQAITKAGTMSSLSEAILFTKESVTEEAPRITSPKNGFITKRPNVLIYGQSKPNVPIKIFVNNLLRSTVKADKRGVWSYNLPSLKDGNYSV
jgi:uncharacterized delta-60 repeat protein